MGGGGIQKISGYSLFARRGKSTVATMKKKQEMGKNVSDLLFDGKLRKKENSNVKKKSHCSK